MSPKAQHTEGPLRIEGPGDGWGNNISIMSPGSARDGACVVTVYATPKWAADAAELVRRWNAHEELVAALERWTDDDPFCGDELSGGPACVGCFRDRFNGHSGDCRWVASRAALAKAGGK